MVNSENIFQEFPGGPVITTLCSHCRDLGSISGWGTNIPQALRLSKREKKKRKKIYSTKKMVSLKHTFHIASLNLISRYNIHFIIQLLYKKGK